MASGHEPTLGEARKLAKAVTLESEAAQLRQESADISSEDALRILATALEVAEKLLLSNESKQRVAYSQEQERINHARDRAGYTGYDED